MTGERVITVFVPFTRSAHTIVATIDVIYLRESHGTFAEFQYNWSLALPMLNGNRLQTTNIVLSVTKPWSQQ